MPNVKIRIADQSMSVGISEIYNEGIQSGAATFETTLRTPQDIEEWFADNNLVITANIGKHLAGFAVVFPYRKRECYVGVGEFSVYVQNRYHGQGVGTHLMGHLTMHAETKGYWKLLSRVFPENRVCRAMLKNQGFREVGMYERHAKLHGVWRDVVIVERSLQRS